MLQPKKNKKKGIGSYPPGHLNYGKMGPRTMKEYQSINLKNSAIDKIISGEGPAGTIFVTKKPKVKA